MAIVALMLRLRRLLTILTILGLALGSMVSAARQGAAADASGTPIITSATPLAAPLAAPLATVMVQDGRAACEACAPGQGGMMNTAAAGCHGGLCSGLAGVLPESPVISRSAPARFGRDAAPVPDGLSHPPGGHPPKAAGHATPASPDLRAASV